MRWSRRFTRFAGSFSLAVGVVVAGSAPALADDAETDIESEEVVIQEPFFAAPTVLSPGRGEAPNLVMGPEGEWFWILEVTNSDYQPGFRLIDGYVGFETLPSVGVFDSVAERLAWTNETFACFVGTRCEPPAQTPDQRAFGEDFVRLPKLYLPTTGVVAYHAEHAYQGGQDPFEWVVGQETLAIAIPLAATPQGVIDVWVGYTYVYTDDLVGVPVRFTDTAMAVTSWQVSIPGAPDDGGPAAPGGGSAGETNRDDGGLPPWVAQGVLGIVGILAFFGILALIVSRMVALSRQ